MTLKVKRVYRDAAKDDGFRVLVDRVWPRGVRKESAAVDLWLKELAPSTGLRKWFAHDPRKWPEFKARYFRELDDNPEPVARLAEAAARKNLCLVFSAKDEKHNNAVALKEYLEERFDL